MNVREKAPRCPYPRSSASSSAPSLPPRREPVGKCPRPCCCSCAANGSADAASSSRTVTDHLSAARPSKPRTRPTQQRTPTTTTSDVVPWSRTWTSATPRPLQLEHGKHHVRGGKGEEVEAAGEDDANASSVADAAAACCLRRGSFGSGSVAFRPQRTPEQHPSRGGRRRRCRRPIDAPAAESSASSSMSRASGNNPSFAAAAAAAHGGSHGRLEQHHRSATLSGRYWSSSRGKPILLLLLLLLLLRGRLRLPD